MSQVEAETTGDRLEHDEAVNLYDWMSGFGAIGAIKVTLDRKMPKNYKGIMCSGRIGEYDEPVSQEQVEQEHGGGKFQIKVQHIVKLKGSGAPTWRYAGARTFEIAGTPRIDSLVRDLDDEGEGKKLEEGPVGQAMNMALRMAQKAEDRADRERDSRNDGTDWEALTHVTGPIREEMTALRQQNADLQANLMEKMGEKPDTGHVDKVLGMWGESNSDHSTRIAEIRTAHDSELRQIRDFNREEIKRREDRFERELESSRKSQEREIDTMRSTQGSSMDSQKNAFEMRIDGLREIQKRLERELTESRTELAALRAKKDQAPLEQIQGLVQLKNGFEALVPTGGDDETPTWLKALEALGVGDLVGGVASRIAGAPAEGEQGAEPMIPIRRPDGKIVNVPASMVAAMQARAAQEGAEGEGGAGAGKPASEVEVPAEDLARAIAFIEAAVRNGTEPEVFGATARNMVPASILSVIKRQGVDHFLNNVAQLEDGSPLATVAGRNWVRKVARFLLEGTTDGVDDEPPSPVES